eukprot:CAMPEP_0183332830 /NCGR_PEP_ID=MMETSP0164_2-20130417/1894_1 /TAXON_ID=221442 /ORGANISM="Coccolithus pelagicus ssp braarudi, Strain PLY182g" /LENGTH=93 /DNA_ID=CAMNT_0025501627 /DNA_START=368 /DNA_END=646 /DNA_ORIENTATION=+
MTPAPPLETHPLDRLPAHLEGQVRRREQLRAQLARRQSRRSRIAVTFAIVCSRQGRRGPMHLPPRGRLRRLEERLHGLLRHRRTLGSVEVALL